MDMCEYIEAASSQIRARRARDMVARELSAHIEDQAAYYREQGMAEAEAQAEAVRQMGDPVEVGISMDQIHRPRTDWKMILMLAFLCVLGLCLQISFNREMVRAQMIADGMKGSLGVFSGVTRGLVMALAGAVILGVLVCVMDYTVILRYAPGFICLMLLLLWLEGVIIWRIGERLALPRNWHYLLVPLYANLLYRYRGRSVRNYVGAISLLLLLPILRLGGILAFGGTSGLRFGLVLMVMLSTAVVCGWYGDRRGVKLLCLWGSALLLSCLAVWWMLWQGGFRGERIRAILHPYEYAASAGYYVIMMRGWIGRCSLWGNPEAASQFAQSYTGVIYLDPSFSPADNNLLYLFLRYGIVPGVIVCLIFLGCVGYFLYRCLHQKNQLGRVTGTGCCIVFLAEFAAYLMSNLGAIPMYARLPFLTYGGIDIQIWAVLTGLVFSIIRYQNLLPAEPVNRARKYKYRLKIEKIAL